METENNKYTAVQIANYFIDKVKEIDNFKLNKFVYSAYGIGSAYYNLELFKDEIQAWEHGPVIPEVYCKFKNYGNKNIKEKYYFLKNGKKTIPSIIDNASSSLQRKTEEILDTVIEIYSSMSKKYFYDEFHDENSPWARLYKPNIKNIKIPKEEIKAYYPIPSFGLPNRETIVALLSEPEPKSYSDFKSMLKDLGI